MARERSARVRKVPGRLAERAGSFTHKPPAAPKPSSAPSGASANAKRAKAVSAGGSFARPRKKAAVAATDVPANGSRPRRVTPNKRAHEDATAELNPQPIQRLLSCRAVTRRVVQRAKPPRKSNPLSRASAFFFRPRHRRVAGRRRRAASSRRATEEAAAVHVVRGDAGQGGARGGQGQGGEGRQKGQGRRLG